MKVKMMDLYDTRHAVFRPARMSAAQLESGYRRAYREFYRWRSIVRGAAAHGELAAGVRHVAYAAGWKTFEPLWDLVIRARRVGAMLPLLEEILGFRDRVRSAHAARTESRGSHENPRSATKIPGFQPAITKLAVPVWSTPRRARRPRSNSSVQTNLQVVDRGGRRHPLC